MPYEYERFLNECEKMDNKNINNILFIRFATLIAMFLYA